VQSRCHQDFQYDHRCSRGTLKHTRETATKANIAAEAKGLLGNIDFGFILALKVSRTDTDTNSLDFIANCSGAVCF
jgi:hypothetical protein